MILGESEVLGQVATAHEWAMQANASGPIRGGLPTAVRAGRRARVETAICRNPMSIASEAVRLVREIAVGGVRGVDRRHRRTGPVAGNSPAQQRLHQSQRHRRNPDRAISLVPAIGARALPWQELGEGASRD
jgi:hypothetical protein